MIQSVFIFLLSGLALAANRAAPIPGPIPQLQASAVKLAPAAVAPGAGSVAALPQLAKPAAEALNAASVRPGGQSPSLDQQVEAGRMDFDAGAAQAVEAVAGPEVAGLSAAVSPAVEEAARFIVASKWDLFVPKRFSWESFPERKPLSFFRPGLSRAQLVEAYLLAARRTRGVAVEIQINNRLKQDQWDIGCLRLAFPAGQTKSFWGWDYGQAINLGDLDYGERFALLKAFSSAGASAQFQATDYYYKDGVRQEGYSGMGMPADFEPLAVVAFALKPYMSQYGLKEPDDLEGFKALLKRFAAANSGLIEPRLVDLAWDRVSDAVVGGEVLKLALRREYAGMPPARDSLELVSMAAGFDPAVLAQARLSDQQAKALYAACLDLQDSVGSAPFAGIRLSPQLWDKKHLPDLLVVLHDLRNLLYLEGGGAAWATLAKDYLGGGLSPDGLPALKKRLAGAIESRVISLFGEHEFKVTHEQLESVRRRWGTLDPVFTLLARFKGNEQWKEEIPVLAQAFQAILDGRFKTLKFSNEEQLAPLKTQAQRQAWQKTRSRLAVFEPSRESEADFEARKSVLARLIVSRDLLPNLGPSAVARPAEMAAIVAAIVSGPAGAPDPGSALKVLLRSYSPATIAAVASAALAARIDMAELLALARFLKFSGPRLGLSTQSRHDVDSITRALDERPASAQPSLVLTSTFHDPRLLLTIGDLVDTSSCQHFRTGSVVDTLLGYVLDSNVQGVASWVLGRQQFASSADYEAALKASREGGISIKFNGESGKAILSWREGRIKRAVLASLPAHAHLRRMLKLGSVEGGSPGLALEKPYIQNHPALDLMQSEILAIEAELAAKLGASTSQEVSFPASGNPGGVYSDLASGRQKGPYSVKPQKAVVGSQR